MAARRRTQQESVSPAARARPEALVRSALAATGLSKAGREALIERVDAALDAALRSQRRTVSRLAAVRALKAEGAGLDGGGVSLVPLVMARRDQRLADEHLPSERIEPLRRAADALVLHLVRSGARDQGRRAQGSAQADAAKATMDRLLRVLPDAVMTLRASGRVGLWSVGASRLTGRRRYEVHRRGLARCFQEPGAWEQLVTDVRSSGRVDGRELALQHASGVVVPIRVHGARLRLTGRAMGQDPDDALFVLTDRTEIHQIRARLIETEKLSAMAKIAGSVAHEFRNPLNSLFLSTDLLEDELEGRADVRQAIGPTLAAIREEIERLNQIITHYLALSQIGGEEPEELDLGEQVEGYVTSRREEGEEGAEQRVSIRLRADAGPHPIRVDRHQLRAGPRQPRRERAARRARVEGRGRARGDRDSLGSAHATLRQAHGERQWTGHPRRGA